MSASPGPDRRRGAVGEIDAAVGQADIVDDGARSRLAGMTSRMVASTWSQSAAVSSMRVPVRARTCSLICPPSTVGKEILAEPGQRGRAETPAARSQPWQPRNIAAKRGRRCRRRRQQAHDSRSRSSAKPRSNAVESAAKSRAPSGVACGVMLLAARNLASVGTSVRDRMYEASMANTTASASGTNRNAQCRPAGTSARTQCRSRASRPTPAGRSVGAVENRLLRRPCPARGGS